MKFLSKNVNQTINLGKSFATTLKGGEVILLCGDLGAGKTHFCKGVADGLGVKQLVTSPTFTLHNQYNDGRLTLNHFDFYRIVDEEEVEVLGLTDYFYDKNGVCLIEWWQNAEGLIPPFAKKVTIDQIGQNKREITIDD